MNKVKLQQVALYKEISDNTLHKAIGEERLLATKNDKGEWEIDLDNEDVVNYFKEFEHCVLKPKKLCVVCKEKPVARARANYCSKECFGVVRAAKYNKLRVMTKTLLPNKQKKRLLLASIALC